MSTDSEVCDDCGELLENCICDELLDFEDEEEF